jgi:transposase InsO family protein
MITERQYQLLMKEYRISGVISTAALKANMDRETGTRYIEQGHGPQPQKARGRRRPDPLATIWAEAERILGETPELEGKLLFEHLLEKHGCPAEAQRALRTFQRRVAQWRRHHGAPLEVFFPQTREPAASLQLDWTHGKTLGVTIAGQAWSGLLCHTVLPYSNWEWAVPCLSESLLSLRSGAQEAYWALGGVSKGLQTDHSSTATHVLSRQTGQRVFNTDYLALCDHLGVKALTINVGRPNENGDIESSHGHLKRRLRTHLALRGSHDFADLAEWANYVAGICTAANALRSVKVAEERAALGPLPQARFPEVDQARLRVCTHSTIRLKGCAYSVPARLIGSWVDAEQSEAEVVVRHEGQEVLRCPRAVGQRARIDYRHVIESLVRKPGALTGYLYREEMFPRPVFRQTYDRLCELDERQAARHYTTLLHLASRLGENEVGTRLGQCLRAGDAPWPQYIEALLAKPRSQRQEITQLEPTLSSYDQLLEVSV